MEVNEPNLKLQRMLIDVCLETQAALGNDNAAVIEVVNGVMQAFVEYCVRCTTKDPVVGQERFNELSMDVGIVAQKFFTKHVGAAMIVELPRKRPEK